MSLGPIISRLFACSNEEKNQNNKGCVLYSYLYGVECHCTGHSIFYGNAKCQYAECSIFVIFIDTVTVVDISVNAMTVKNLYKDALAVVEISIDAMSVVEMSVDAMTVVEMSIDPMTVVKCL